MSAECYPITVLPHVSRFYADYLAMQELSVASAVHSWYAAPPTSTGWMLSASSGAPRELLADALRTQGLAFQAGPAAFANIQKLRTGARAVVTGQQVGLFGGPLLTLLKAATATARAAEATRQTGIDHVPVFWLASEDHDLAEVDQVTLPGREAPETLTLGLQSDGREVGALALGPNLEATLDRAGELLGYTPICDLLRVCYTSGATLASAFARLMAALFARHGLIVMDASGRDFHALGAPTLRAALERAEPLEQALLARTAELEHAGYPAQVLVKPGASLLFLVDPVSGARQPLRRTSSTTWKAGGFTGTTAGLLTILEQTPERLSPNALLRPVFQDSILPTSAYIGGPAEIAYFAQSEVIYRQILGRVTPVLPRFSATLVEPALLAVMARHELTLAHLFDSKTPEALAQHLGARALPIAGKRKLAAAGNAMDSELEALTTYLAGMDDSLGRSALVSASKMRYQMNRLRRMAATFEVQKEASLNKHARALFLNLFPGGHPQERVLGGVSFLGRSGEDLVDRLVQEAAGMCLGHTVLHV